VGLPVWPTVASTCRSLIDERGIELKAIAEIAGHSGGIRTTAVYVDVNSAAARPLPAGRLYRMAQKYLPTGSRFGRWEDGKLTRNLPLSMFPKDGNVKNSGLSYFIQIADLLCYAARLKLEYEMGELAAKRIRRDHHTVYDSIPRAQLNTLATFKRRDAIVPT
jgi:hypothetical protein